MARYSDEVVVEAITPHLGSGERLVNYAYGVKQPPIAVIALLILLGIIPGLIAIAVMTKEYVVALTDRRFIVLRVSGRRVAVKEVTAYNRANMPPVEASTGSLFTHIRIRDAVKPFVAKFHRLGMSENRRHSQAIETALTAK